MSQNVLSKQTLARLPHIKNGLIKGSTHDTIGKHCGVTEKTIDRDIDSWVKSGFFETWIKTEFLRLHPVMCKAYPELVYRELARLMGKMAVHRQEINVESTQKIVSYEVMKIDSEDRKLLEAAARKYIKASNPTESNVIH